MFGAIVVSLLLTAVAYAIAPRPPQPKNAVAGELDVPEPPVGKPVPVVFGTVWVKSPGVIYSGNKGTREIKSGGGGKK